LNNNNNNNNINKPDIIIIEDDKDICSIMVQHCESLALFRNIVVAHDGMLATLKLKNQSFELILLDINMPKKNGESIIEELSLRQTHGNKIESVFVISGDLDRELMRKCINYGVRNFISKPFDEEIFKNKILNFMNSKK
jgi:response regulator of citrate/malate metabolism